MKHLFTKKELCYLISAVVLGLVSLFFVLRYNKAVFPEINIDLQIRPEQAKQQAAEFLRSLDVATDRYKKATIFTANDQVKEYLEKNLTPAEAGRLMNDRINAWNFSTRFFIPATEEEYQVDYDNLGRLSAFSRRLPDSRPGAALKQAQALAMAENFIKERTRFALAELTLTDKNFINQANRRDFRFTWEEARNSIVAAKYKISCLVAGDEVAGFEQYLDIPETWSRQQAALAARNNTAQITAEAIYFILILMPLLVILVRKYRRRQPRYGMALPVACLAASVTLLIFIVSLPQTVWLYDTAASWSNFWASIIFYGAVGAIFSGLWLGLTVLAAEAIYREQFTFSIDLGRYFNKKIFRHKPIFMSLVLGFGAGFTALAYQMIYYYLGRLAGFWVPAEINYDNIFSTYLPWVYVLSIALIPALTEEVTFRLFGISLGKKILKKTWLALIFTALIWSFLHSAYPQTPFFARGLELLPVGIFFGWLFLKFGILTSVTAHYTMNAALAAQLMFKWQSPEAKIGALAVLLLPLIIALAMLCLAIIKKYPAWLNNALSEANGDQPLTTGRNMSKFMESNHASNQAVAGGHISNGSLQQISVKPPSARYAPLSRRMKILLWSACLSGALIIVLFQTAQITPGDDLSEPRLQYSRYEISRLADNYLTKLNVNPLNYVKTVAAGEYFDQEAKDYLLAQGGQEQLMKLYDKHIPGMVWTARYVKPLDKEAYELKLLFDGSVYSYDHILRQDKSGARLNQEQARQLAEDYLIKETSYDPTDEELMEAKEEKQTDRIDYHFTYKNKSLSVGQGSLRTSLSVKGDEVSGFSRYFAVPSDWSRDQSKESIKNFLLGAAIFIISLGIFMASVFSFLELYRRRAINWKQGFIITAGALMLTLAAEINNLTAYYNLYDGTEAIGLYHLKQIIFSWFGFGLLAFFGAAVFPLALALTKKYVSNDLLPPDGNKIARQSLLIGYGSAGLVITALGILAVGLLSLVQGTSWEKYFIVLPALPTGINQFLPALAALTDSAMTIWLWPVLLIPGLAMYRYVKKGWLAILILASLVVLSLLFQTDYKIILLGIGALIFALAGAILLYRYIYRQNILALPIALYLIAVLSSAPNFNQVNLFYKINGIIIYLSLLLPFAVIWLVGKYYYSCHSGRSEAESRNPGGSGTNVNF